jgi:pimeloyl-ACP methyl ester carboxylesterase
MQTLSLLVLFGLALYAQPALKSIPPAGIAVPAADRAELEASLARLDAATAKLAKNPLLPDVLVFREAVRFALQYDEFFKPAEIAAARGLLRQAEERAAQLAAGQAPWTTATGLVVRGYVSKIDGSVQPYGLVVPPSYSPTASHRWRLDLWHHGRNETLSQLNFLTDRQKSAGEFTPPDTIVLHLYGRYCNAAKFAGEIDTFEALDAVRRAYPIDENRILLRGFSMGGATVWHMAAHYPSIWAAAAPGAGFAETARYQKMKLDGPGAPPWWEQTLFHYYDAVDYAANFFNLPVIEYHGEIDPQQQAGDVMAEAMANEGMRLARIEGPQTQHKYHPDSKIQLARDLDAIAERGRDPWPRKVVFTTFTLNYNNSYWVTLDSLNKHWERARIDAEVAGPAGIAVTTTNVAAFTLAFGSGGCPLDPAAKSVVTIDGQKLATPPPGSDRSWTAHFRRTGDRWAVVESAVASGLHKRRGLQGPIDDAFLDRFVFVTPTGSPISPAVGQWAAGEEKRAIAEWRRQFRGDAIVREDREITDAEIASSNLILWGDPLSNRVLARIADRLPVKWTADGIVAGTNHYSAADHAPILIYPNPLNPNRYVVLNSGFTFREADYTSNSRQTPKLPDYAVVDITTPPDRRFPGKIVLAGFFDEDWHW